MGSAPYHSDWGLPGHPRHRGDRPAELTRLGAGTVGFGGAQPPHSRGPTSTDQIRAQVLGRLGLSYTEGVARRGHCYRRWGRGGHVDFGPPSSGYLRSPRLTACGHVWETDTSWIEEPRVLHWKDG